MSTAIVTKHFESGLAKLRGEAEALRVKDAESYAACGAGSVSLSRAAAV